ncbi:hypothetical protein ABTN81_19775, partial [Acinetobacter baumannii]
NFQQEIGLKTKEIHHSVQIRRCTKKIANIFAAFMKAKTLRRDKVNIITLGCSKNLVDSEVLSGQLAANEIEVVHENEKLDHNIV